MSKNGKKKGEQVKMNTSANSKAAPSNATKVETPKVAKKPGRPYSTRTPINQLIGQDARGSAWRNNLIKNLAENVEAVKKLTDDEALRVRAYFGGENATTQAARAFDAALNERCSRVRQPKAQKAA